jgi:hypothetical protein
MNAYPLVILLLGNLFHLVHQLPESEMKFGQFFLLSHLSVIDSVFTYLDVEMDALEKR